LYAIEGVSQRRAAEITGVSRDTLRKREIIKETKTDGREATHG
jgi:DNA-binding protein Fis